MTTTTINPSNIRTIQGASVNTTELKKIERFVGLDPTAPLRTRGASQYTRPDFELYIHDNDEGTYEEFNATVVVNRLLELLAALEPGTTIAVGTPVALGMTLLDNEEWYILFRYNTEAFTPVLTFSEVLVRYDGEPESLMLMPELFELNEPEEIEESEDD